MPGQTLGQSGQVQLRSLGFRPSLGSVDGGRACLWGLSASRVLGKPLGHTKGSSVPPLPRVHL